MVEKRLRYFDLVRLGIVKSRTGLQSLIIKHGFPRGQLTGPNSRTYGEREVEVWLASRPTAPKSTPSTKRRRKAESARAEA
jgi:hypothetical protein